MTPSPTPTWTGRMIWNWEVSGRVVGITGLEGTRNLPWSGAHKRAQAWDAGYIYRASSFTDSRCVAMHAPPSGVDLAWGGVGAREGGWVDGGIFTMGCYYNMHHWRLCRCACQRLKWRGYMPRYPAPVLMGFGAWLKPPLVYYKLICVKDRAVYI